MPTPPAGPTQYSPGPQLFDPTLMQNGYGYTFTDGITAKSGGGQATAVLLTSAINNVTTVAVANDSVQLPLAIGGQEITCINAGGNSLQVFGNVAGTDTIDGTAGSTGVAIATGKTRVFLSVAVGKWRSLLSA